MQMGLFLFDGSQFLRYLLVFFGFVEVKGVNGFLGFWFIGFLGSQCVVWLGFWKTAVDFWCAVCFLAVWR